MQYWTAVVICLFANNSCYYLLNLCPPPTAHLIAPPHQPQPSIYTDHESMQYELEIGSSPNLYTLIYMPAVDTMPLTPLPVIVLHRGVTGRLSLRTGKKTCTTIE